jgi:RNA polymerase sporulation-specific sigma factor
MSDSIPSNKKSCRNVIKIEDHLGLVHSCCQRFRRRGLDYDDVFQSGCMGLTKAAKNFDPTKGVQFSTYAVPVILGEIKALFRSSGSLKVSRSLKELAVKVGYERERFLKFYEREPSLGELADLLGVEQDQILEALDASRAPVSLDMPSSCNEDRPIAEIPVEFNDEIISIRLSIFQILDTFEARDKNLIYLRFFKGITQIEVAENLGMTQVQA